MRMMLASRRALSTLAVLLTQVVTPVFAQTAVPELPAPSPKARIEQRVGLTDVSVEYSSPGVKGRKIWGELVPYNQPWRTGANAATKLTVSRDIVFGNKAIPAGTYALYTIPGKNSWTVVLNSSSESWGTAGLDTKKDVARINVKPVAVPSRERLGFLFSNTTDDSTRLDLEWEKVRLSVPIRVDTKKQALANIESALEDAWRPHFSSARWLLENGGDADKALTYIERSIQIKPTWWNKWVRAQILSKKGRTADAVAAAEEARTLGKGDRVFEGFFKEEVEKTLTDWKGKS